MDSGASLLFGSLPITVQKQQGVFPPRLSFLLGPVFPFPAPLILPCPHSSVIPWYRNLNLLSIGYGFRPRLRSRLTQGRSALPWNPWIFGLEDSHLHLATHSGILPSYPSTAPYKAASPVLRMLPYRCIAAPRGFGGVFEPRTFSAQGLSTSELLRTL